MADEIDPELRSRFIVVANSIAQLVDEAAKPLAEVLHFYLLAFAERGRHKIVVAIDDYRARRHAAALWQLVQFGKIQSGGIDVAIVEVLHQPYERRFEIVSLRRPGPH